MSEGRRKQRARNEAVYGLRSAELPDGWEAVTFDELDGKLRKDHVGPTGCAPGTTTLCGVDVSYKGFPTMGGYEPGAGYSCLRCTRAAEKRGWLDSIRREPAHA